MVTHGYWIHSSLAGYSKETEKSYGVFRHSEVSI